MKTHEELVNVCGSCDKFSVYDGIIVGDSEEPRYNNCTLYLLDDADCPQLDDLVNFEMEESAKVKEFLEKE